MASQRLRDRTMDFAVRIIRFIKTFSHSFEDAIIAKQLVRSATSIASNYRAACRSRSKAEYFSKICIVVEESDETLFWLELLMKSGMIKDQNVEELHEEATEL